MQGDGALVGARALWPAAAGGGKKYGPAVSPTPFDVGRRRAT